MLLLANLRELKDNMVKLDWTICSFLFEYNKISYIVLVKRFLHGEKKSTPWSLVKLHFMKSNNSADELKIEANSQELLTDARTLRQYFGINYAPNLGNILEQFTVYLGKHIPVECPENYTEQQKQAMIRSLSKSDSEDWHKIYPISVLRNPLGKHRSPFNADKTKLICPKLWEYYSDDKRISFCYSADKSQEKDVATIIKQSSINA